LLRSAATLAGDNRTQQHNFYFASNQIFKDLRSATRDPFQESGLHAGLESRSDKITLRNAQG
jgi:hypothetical protein